MLRLSLLVLLLSLAAFPAAAHDLPAAELARLNALVAAALESGWTRLVLLAGSGVALGALHGLEPGHSKTMMAAFIVAIRGSVGQAALLGAAATVSHTAVVWLLVVPLLAWGGAVDLAGNAPYFQIASALAVLAVAGWTAWRLWRQRPPARVTDAAPQQPAPIDTGHGLVRLSLIERNDASYFHVDGIARSGRVMPFHEDVTVTTRTADGTEHTYVFAGQDSTQPVPLPHDLLATLRIAHGDHGHAFTVPFGRAALPEAEPLDAHARGHAEALRARLAQGRAMTPWQIVLFGLSGGLLPCPAAVTVLLLCLQLKRIGLGVLLVASFSLGLAVTMIAVGAAAALATRHATRRWAGLAALAPAATYGSCALIAAIGLYMLAEGLDALA